MTDIPTVSKRQKTTCVLNPTERAKEMLGPAYNVIATHQQSLSFTNMTRSCLIRYLVRIERGYEDYGWEPKPSKLHELSEFDYDHSDNPSLHKFFSTMSPQDIIGFMDNLYAFDADKYDLFKRLLTGKACQESDVTVWKKWVEQQIPHLPHFSVAS